MNTLIPYIRREFKYYELLPKLREIVCHDNEEMKINELDERRL